MKKSTTFPKEKIEILLLEGVHPAALKLFKENGYSNIEVVQGAADRKSLKEKIKNVHLLGIRSKTQVDDEIISHGKRLLGIGAFCIGTNQIDMDSAVNHGVAVFNSPFSNTRSVAELVIAHCINLMRRLFEKSEAAHKGQWLKDSSNSYEVRGKTLGIIGYGHIGSQVSILAENLGMKVIFFDIEPKLPLGNATAVKTLDDLLRKSDIVTLHVPGSGGTKNLLNESRIAKMKSGAHLINLSRGDVVDLNAVRKALEKKQLAGFACDVFPVEPTNNQEQFQSPVQGLSNVILTPHIGGSTVEAQENIGVDVAGKLISFLETGSSTGSLSVPALSLPVQADAHRLLHIHANVPGVLGEINSALSKLNVNILGQYLKTNNQIGYVVLDVDKKTSARAMDELKKVKNTIRVRELY
ncbi:MAG: phosphoglycerate dehydrogenase [Bacteroidetes bacterium]|nr:MAG: phosphoglycerate dehydrogenase [Bacteroidota bacterium]REK04952.1 MAG: phosphoglycerate dehydrogenase [Bacteroidota bacterium]REK36544.1 MAG: phosphoglycerate dehydrogenase [Bacteroidota bacterium]REK50910.1 MAG: phosphoglycerate dehydrogenase [Bacteroidota bacterium]